MDSRGGGGGGQPGGGGSELHGRWRGLNGGCQRPTVTRARVDLCTDVRTKTQT